MRKHSVPLAQVLNLWLTLLYKLFTSFYLRFRSTVLKCAICELSLNERFL